jgi:hypothetical protein
MVLIAKRIHRLPKAAVLVRDELTARGELLERLALPRGVVALDFVDRSWFDHEEPAVDSSVPSPSGFSGTC